MELDYKSNQSGIYKWIFPNGKIYIGKANNFNQRYSHYKNDRTKTNVVNLALRKYGFYNCIFKIVEICEGMPISEILFRESLWIKFYQSTNRKFGYNLSAYSHDRTGVKHTEASKEKMRIASTGKKPSEESLRKMREFQSRRPKRKFCAQARENIRLSIIGRRASSQTKEKLRQRAIEKRHLFIVSVNQLDKNGNFIRKWNSFAEANQFLNNNETRIDISGVVRGKRKLAYGFKWEYANKDKN